MKRTIKFKFPYNFQESTLINLNDLLSNYSNDDYEIVISSVYCSPFIDHMGSARDDVSYAPKTLDEYKYHISLIQKYGYDPDILMQLDGNMLSDDMLNFYLDMGVRHFTIADNDLAIRLRKLSKEQLYITASITKVLSPEDIKTLDLSMYDEICLFFWFNMHLKTISELPKKYKYQVLINSNCSCECKSHDTHWFGENRGQFICPEDGTKGCGITELEFFYDYIESFKLQGRDYIDGAVYSLKIYLDRIFGTSDTSEYERGYDAYYDSDTVFPNKDN